VNVVVGDPLEVVDVSPDEVLPVEVDLVAVGGGQLSENPAFVAFIVPEGM
jgi:hypothetical protein